MSPQIDPHRLGLDLVSIPGGQFEVGIGFDDSLTYRTKGGRFTTLGRYRTFVRQFRIMRHPVTVAEYSAYLRSKKMDDALYANNGVPVTAITHKEAAAFAKWAGGRLPTALEWEVALRGQHGQPLPWGWSWPADLVALAELPRVGSRPDLASPFGVEEGMGSVLQWTADTIEDHAVAKGSPYNHPFGHLSEVCMYRPGTRVFNLGFRVLVDGQF